VCQKLYADLYSPFDETLFIDSDCLAFGVVDSLWHRYRSEYGFSAMGGYAWPNDGHYAVPDLVRFCHLLGLSRIGFYNTGLLWFDRSSGAKSVFDAARSIADRSGELGLSPYRGASFNDEPVFGAATELCEVPPLPSDGGETMALGCFGTEAMRTINVLRGDSRHTVGGKVVQPLLIHFNAGSQRSRVYDRELRRLALGPVWGLTPLPACIAGVSPRLRYYRTRIGERMRSHGLLGLVPARFWALSQARRRSR